MVLILHSHLVVPNKEPRRTRTYVSTSTLLLQTTCSLVTAPTSHPTRCKQLWQRRQNSADIQPLSVQSYMDHYCNNSTDRRILNMFLSICNDLSKLCHKLEAVHPGNSTTNGILERCKLLLSHSNDLSTIRAKYPHDVVNHLSCDEAKNHYGGVVSLIPIVLDCMKEWLYHTEKLPRYQAQHSTSVSTQDTLFLFVPWWTYFCR
uniref:Sperm acrosome associated 9 n=1 Tax=Anas platyrhynchos platyrhynchos TaxID=8840 RepID=U3I3Q4_ANAPP